MKYRFKIDTPWGKRGSILEWNPRWCFSGDDFVSYMSPENYPDIFEEFSDSVEKVANFISKEIQDYAASLGNFVYQIKGVPACGADFTYIARKLLAAGLDPEKLK